MSITNGKRNSQQVNFNLNYEKSLNWLKKNTLPEQGIVVTSKQRIPYLEVTGYLIPTLIEAGEFEFAERFAEYLSYMQRPNGGFSGSDGKEYFFDTGMVLKGLLAASKIWPRFKSYALKTANFLAASVEKNGRLPATYGNAITENVHVYLLPALVQAGGIFDEKKFLEVSQTSLEYYKDQPDILNTNVLSHFLAYVIDGFIDLGEIDFIKPLVTRIFSTQKKDGRISAFPNVNWICSTGLAQLSIIAYKLGMNDEADKAVSYLCKIQNPSGGFYGSYGSGATYFPSEEISWATKFFMDSLHRKNQIENYIPPKKEKATNLGEKEWHSAIVGQKSPKYVKEKLRNNDFPIWIKSLLENSSVGDSLLELGSGSGELSGILGLYGRNPHLLDNSIESIDFAKALFRELDINGNFYVENILGNISLHANSIDWVWSSGLLEHFSDGEIIHILKESARICKKGVMSLVPNANSLMYRVGKYKMEQDGTWIYGKEEPKYSMRSYFETCGFKNIIEFSVGHYHSLQFVDSQKDDIIKFYDSLSLQEMKRLNQGYLLFTYGEKI